MNKALIKYWDMAKGICWALLDVWSVESRGWAGESFCLLWFMCVFCARRPCKFISTGPVQQHNLLLFSPSPHNNKVSQTWCLTLIYDPSQKFNFRYPLSLWKRKVSVPQTSGINNGDFNQYDSDLPLRAFTQLLKVFMREARILKQVELNTHLKRSAAPNSIQFDFNIWPWLSVSYRSFFHRLLPYWWVSGDRCVLDIISTCLLMRTYGFFFYLLFSLPKLK